MDPYVLWATRAEALPLTGFRLPLASIPPELRARLSATAIRDRLTVPARTADQMRTLERHGLCDQFIAKNRKQPKPNDSVFVLWRRPKRRRGDVALYSLLDIATARLVGWLLKEGLSYGVVRDVLRGPGGVARALLMYAIEEVPGAVLAISPYGGAIYSPEGLRDSRSRAPDVAYREFPLAWLGIKTDVLPRLSKTRETHPTVTRWRQEVTPASLHLERADVF